jgi:hypothetical protein
MPIRPAALFLVLTALAGTAHAERLHTGGLPVANNMMIANNLAAGFGNQAHQQVMGAQAAPGNPLVVNNTQVATNVAAGIGNQASQGVVGLQGAAPLVGLDFSGRGPLVTTNTAVNTNVAAGIGNHAVQGVLTQQR